jgi:D-aminoacyl-tRNA deacylase
MIGLLQRVSQASVSSNDDILASIGPGLLVLIGVERGDSRTEADRLLRRLIGYRVFPDIEGKMNLSLTDTGGELLLVPQFTLPADTRKGMRPSFSTAASPAEGQLLFEYLCDRARSLDIPTACGQFGADMQISLVNEGPVTFWLQVPPHAYLVSRIS